MLANIRIAYKLRTVTNALAYYRKDLIVHVNEKRGQF